MQNDSEAATDIGVIATASGGLGAVRMFHEG